MALCAKWCLNTRQKHKKCWINNITGCLLTYIKLQFLIMVRAAVRSGFDLIPFRVERNWTDELIGTQSNYKWIQQESLSVMCSKRWFTLRATGYFILCSLEAQSSSCMGGLLDQGSVWVLDFWSVNRIPCFMSIGALLISEEGIGSQLQDGTDTLRCTERLRIKMVIFWLVSMN